MFLHVLTNLLNVPFWKPLVHHRRFQYAYSCIWRQYIYYICHVLKRDFKRISPNALLPVTGRQKTKQHLAATKDLWFGQIRQGRFGCHLHASKVLQRFPGAAKRVWRCIGVEEKRWNRSAANFAHFDSKRKVIAWPIIVYNYTGIQATSQIALLPLFIESKRNMRTTFCGKLSHACESKLMRYQSILHFKPRKVLANSPGLALWSQPVRSKQEDSVEDTNLISKMPFLEGG